MAWNEDIKWKLGSCGEGVKIGHNVIFTTPWNVHLGDYVRIDPFTLVTASLHAGSYIQVCSHVVIGGGSNQKVLLEDWTFVGYGSKLFTASEDYSGEHGPVNEFWGKNKVHRGDITISQYGGVASDVIVMPGVTVPEGCCVGAKSFVYSDKDLEPWSVFLGSPLRFHKKRNEEKVRELGKVFAKDLDLRG